MKQAKWVCLIINPAVIIYVMKVKEAGPKPDTASFIVYIIAGLNFIACNAFYDKLHYYRIRFTVPFFW
jgi:hypothetical protein